MKRYVKSDIIPYTRNSTSPKRVLIAEYRGYNGRLQLVYDRESETIVEYSDPWNSVYRQEHVHGLSDIDEVVRLFNLGVKNYGGDIVLTKRDVEDAILNY